MLHFRDVSGPDDLYKEKLSFSDKAQRHVDILILHYDMDIHVDISTLSIVPDMQNRHGGEKYGRKRGRREEK